MLIPTFFFDYRLVCQFLSLTVFVNSTKNLNNTYRYGNARYANLIEPKIELSDYLLGDRGSERKILQTNGSLPQMNRT